MSIDQLIEAGELHRALAELRNLTVSGAPSLDPALLLSRFGLEVRTQEFAAARETFARLIQAAPEIAPVVQRYAAAANAEALAAGRLVDPSLAARRSSIGLPSAYALAYVKAAFAHASGDTGTAAAAIAEGRALTPPMRGTLTFFDGRTMPFSHIIDTDELTGATLPCYHGDAILDLPFADVRRVRFLSPKTSFDVMWLAAEVTLVDGRILEVRVPAYYPGTGLADDAPTRAGRSTMWRRERGYAEGLGQRDFAVTGNDGSTRMVGILQLGGIDLDHPVRALFPSAPTPAAAPRGFGMGAAMGALAAGLLTFFYVGLVGGRATAEVVLSLLALTVVLAVVGVVGGIQDLRRSSTRRGVLTLVLAGLPLVIVGVGALLDKMHHDARRRDDRAARYRDIDPDEHERERLDAREKAKMRQRVGKVDPVRVEVYTMSQCPYCLAVDTTLHEVKQTLGDDVTIQLFYVGNEDPATGALSSMHGADEVTGDLAQVCAAKLSERSLEFIVCQNRSNKEIATNWESCAESTGIPVKALSTCMTGPEGKALLGASFRASADKGVRGAPTIFIGGAQHKGKREKSDFMRAICAAFTGNQPAACRTTLETR